MPKDRFEVAKRRQALRERAIAYKGGACQICAYNRSHAALDFHHLDPMEKDFAISAKMTSFEAIQKELDKCVLVCANCHREIHDGWHPGYLVHEGSDRSAEYDAHDLDGAFDDEPMFDPDLDPRKN